MAKSKKLPALKDLSGYFFMAIEGNKLEVTYHDNTHNGSAIGAALATAIEDDSVLFNLVSAALLTAIEGKEKSISKTAKKVAKTPAKSVKKK